MNYTENLSLGLPEYGESADVAALNRNSGILDAYVYNTRQMECEPYDSTKTYMSGDLAIHNEVIYECNTDNTTGPWDDSKWDSTTLAEQIAKAKQMGGESALADLEDVEITNPSTGQALLFDDSDDKWKNQNLPDVSVTKEASGNPIELTNAANAPLVKCVTAITGSQDLHGYDKPWVGGAGKNKLPMTVSGLKTLNTSGTWSGNTYTFNGVQITIETDGDDNVTGIKEVGTATSGFDFIIAESAFLDGSYKLSFESSSSVDGNLYSLFCKIGDATATYTTTNQSRNISATSSDVLKIRIAHGNGVVIDTIVKPMIRLSTETDPTFAPYSNICPITAYTENTISVGGEAESIYTTDNTSGQNIHASVEIISSNSIRVYRVSGGTGSYISSKQLLTQYSLIEGKKYLVKAYATITSGQGRISVRNSSNTTIATSEVITTNGWLKFEFVYDSSTMNYLSFFATYNQIYGGNVTYSNITFYELVPHTTTFPSAIYRGSEDVVNRSVDTEKIKINVKWGDVTGVVLGDYTRKAFPLSVSAVNNDSAAICNVAPFLADYTSDSLHFYVSSANAYVFLPNDADADTDIEIAYTLATPTTSSVTPTNLPIKSLSGYNHIESSTGEMEIEYITEEYQPLVDLIQSSKHVYSTQEQIVGTWIDGSDVYEQTFTGLSVATNGINWVNLCTIPNAKNIIDCKLYYSATGSTILNLSDLAECANNNGIIQVDITNSTFNRTIVAATIRYTKTTTRSLSAPVTSQKAQIEPLTDKIEEVPTEEEKAVNEEENTNENR